MNEIDFAQYTYECGATDFVDQTFEYDHKKGKSVWNYSFKELYLKSENFDIYPYFVLSLPNKSYLMYEAYKEVFIWMCYTEKSSRRNGYIAELLKELKDQHPNKSITIDTFDESLRQSCFKIGINLFKR